MADIKFSEFPKATTSKDSDEIAILQDGVNKMIASPVLESKIINKTVSRVIEQGGASLNVINLKGVVPTYADLALITPTPELNDAYQVEDDGLVYVYTENGFQTEGEGIKVQPNVNGVVEEGNLNAVSGGEVFDKTVTKIEVLNKDYNPVFVFKNFGVGENLNFEKIKKAIKSIQLLGNWKINGNYQIRFISRNSSNYRIIIQEVDSLGAKISDVFDIRLSVVEAGAGKITKVISDYYLGRRILLGIDFNELSDVADTTLISSNYLIRQTNINTSNLPFVDAGLAKIPIGVETNLGRGIKSVYLYGDFDPRVSYQIRAIYRNHATQKYRIIIASYDSMGEKIADVYDSNPFVITESSGEYTKVTFPTINNRFVVAEIKYSQWADGANDVSSISHNLTINPDNIRAIDVSSKIGSLTNATDSVNFFESGLKPVSANQRLVAKAIKSITLIGNWDVNKKYVFHLFSRNEATAKYRFIIRELLSDGSYASGYTFDSNALTLTEAPVGQTTFVTKTIGDKTVNMEVDYSVLTNGTSLNLGGNNGLVIKAENIKKSNYVVDPFLAKNFGKTIFDEHYMINNAVKDIQLVGDWDNTAYYFIRYITRNSAGYWRVIIGTLDRSGNLINPSFYDGRLLNVVENTNGSTFMEFPLNNRRKLIAEIDWSYLTVGVGYDLTPKIPNFIIAPNRVKSGSESNPFKAGDVISVNGIDTIQEENISHYFSPQYNASRIGLSTSSKKGFISFRTDDNHILKEVVAMTDKFGIRYTLAVNLAILNYTGQEDYFRQLQSRGYEIADHTPNHSTLKIDLPSIFASIFTPYIGNGLDSVTNLNNGLHRVYTSVKYLKPYTDFKFGATNGFRTVSGTSKITGNFSDLRQLSAGTYPTFFMYVYLESSNGTVPSGWSVISATTTGEITLSRIDGTAIAFNANQDISLYIIQEPDLTNVTLDDNATYCLLLAGQLWFRHLGLKAPKTWVQPGGNHPWVNGVSIEKALKKLGMLWAESMDEVKDLTFNAKGTYQYPHSGGWWENAPLHMDYTNQSMLESGKRAIADSVARKEFIAMASHYRWSSFTGATDAEQKTAYLNHLYSLFSWCFENDIEFLTLEERVRMMYQVTTERNANIFPPLYSDKASFGFPDGITKGLGTISLTEGVAESHNHAIKLNGIGKQFEVKQLGGVEFGQNNIEFYIKGICQGEVLIKDLQGNILLEQIFVSDENEFSKVSFDFKIPYNTVWLNIEFHTINSDINSYISGIKI